MEDTRTLSDILSSSPSVELLRLRNRKMTVLFLYETFYCRREPVPYGTLRAQLADYLCGIQLEDDEESGIEAVDSYEEKAAKYVLRWTDRGFLCNYQEEDGEVFYELSSYASKAIDWLLSLKREEFVGTESKFMNLFGQLRELVEFTNEDASERVRMLEQRKMEIEHQIQAIRAGQDAVVYEEYQVLPRFRALTQSAKELLSDFKEVEGNFKAITKSIYQKHAEGGVPKGEILGFTFSALDDLRLSPQGKSFYAFWDFLMTPSQQDAWDGMVDALYASIGTGQMRQDDLFLRNMKGYLYKSAKKVHQANDRMADKLSRIICEKGGARAAASQKLMQDIQSLLLRVAGTGVKPGISLELETQPEIALPMDRKLTLELPVEVDYGEVLEVAGSDIAGAEHAGRLFASQGVDRELLRRRIAKALKKRRQVSLPDVIEDNGGLEHGLAELFGYISAAGSFRHSVHPERTHTLLFDRERRKSIVVPEIIILR